MTTETKTATVAEELRKAATLLRETAAKATPGPWLHHATVGERSEDGHAYTITRPYCGNQTSEWCDPSCGADVLTTGREGCEEDNLTESDAAWIALANPLLAEPLASWLESAAAAYDRDVYLEDVCCNGADACEPTCGGYVKTPIHDQCGRPVTVGADRCECFDHSLAVARSLLGSTR